MDDRTTHHDNGGQHYTNQLDDVRNAVQAGIIHGDVVINPAGPEPPRPDQRTRTMVLTLVATFLAIALTVTLVLVLRRPATTNAAVDTGPPINVVVQNHVLPANGGGDWAIPGTLTPAPATITVGPQLAALVNGLPSAQLGALSLSLVLTGNYTHQLQVTGLHAVVRDHTGPLDGTLLYAPAQGVTDAVDGCVYLGDPEPAIRLADPADDTCDPAGKSFFADHALQLGRGEQKVITLSILPKTGYYEFQLMLDVVASGKSMEIPASATPFRVTTFAQTYRAIYAAPDPDHANLLAVADPATFCPHGCTSGLNG